MVSSWDGHWLMAEHSIRSAGLQRGCLNPLLIMGLLRRSHKEGTCLQSLFCRRQRPVGDFWSGQRWRTLGKGPVRLGLATRTSQLAAALAKEWVSCCTFAGLRGRVLLDFRGTRSSTCSCSVEPSFIFIAVLLILLWAPNDSDYT